jgi:mannose-6-phosphate isomerase-like protein (cupin superfamily)
LPRGFCSRFYQGTIMTPTALTDLPMWQHPLFQMLAAAWATPDDYHYLFPLLQHAEQARYQAYGLLAATNPHARPWPSLQACLEQLCAPAQRCATGESADELSKLPTFALYFELQIQRLAQADPTSLLVHDFAAYQFDCALQRALAKQQNSELALPAPPAMLPNSASEATQALLQRWLDDLYLGLQQQRVASITTKIQAKRSLQEQPGMAMNLASGIGLRAERDDKRKQEFSVARLPCHAQTLDPRIVRIAPGKYNNLHRHAHETLFCLLQGEGEVLVGTNWVPVKAGEAVFAPRWAMHQTRNTGATELVMYAITDYYLSNQVFIGANSTTLLG